MDNYIAQLIEDINKIVSKDVDTASINWKSREGELDVEAYMNGQRYQLQHVLGIAKEALPPENRLNDNQIAKLLPLLHELFEYHHYELAYPTELTNRTKYKLIYNLLEEEHPKTDYGRIGIEFCDYNIDECPIPGECNFCNETSDELELEQAETGDIDISHLLPDGVVTEQNMLDEEHIRKTVRTFKPNKKNIEGIFNYCDRWCERCRFTSKCTQFEMEHEMGIHENENIEDAIKYVSIIFEETGKIIEEKMKELGLDINSLPDVDDIHNNEFENPIELLAVNYMNSVSSWLKKNDDFIAEHITLLWNLSEKKHKQFNEVLSIINWHMTIIPVKVSRALAPKDSFESDNYYDNDRNATGKLVIECVNKSMGAFVVLLDIWPGKNEKLIGFLAMLSKLKSSIEKELPDAKSYIRHGLDEQ